MTDDARKAYQEVDSPPDRLVGRKPELDRLQRVFQRTLRGDRQLVFVTGEPGIGKTALVDVFERQVAADHGLRTARGQCVDGYGGQEPYYPMLEALGPFCRGGGSDSGGAGFGRASTYLGGAVSRIDETCNGRNWQREVLARGRERMLREMADALETITAESPLLVVFEDLQWADSSTVDLLSVLAHRRQPAKLLLLCTYRPVDVLLAEHPLKKVTRDLLIHQLCSTKLPWSHCGKLTLKNFLRQSRR